MPRYSPCLRSHFCHRISRCRPFNSACTVTIASCTACVSHWRLSCLFCWCGREIPEGSWPLITLVVVMGPISSWGNVFPRAVQRIGGTLFGTIAGLIAIKLELFSLPFMLLWCAIVMFISGYLALGKHPYIALLIGITLGLSAAVYPEIWLPPSGAAVMLFLDHCSPCCLPASGRKSLYPLAHPAFRSAAGYGAHLPRRIFTQPGR